MLLLLSAFSMKALAQKEELHVYLCFGQSNMQGAATIETQDKINIDPRFQVLQAVNCSNLGRYKNYWYTAVPPLVGCWTGLCPADYFGRTMIENLPGHIKVGIINVSIAGAGIDLFNEDTYKEYLKTAADWLINIVNDYGGNPYRRLIELGQLAQQDGGIIKGVLLHQGESDNGSQAWPSKVKVIYDRILAELELDSKAVPLLVGETLYQEEGGCCSYHNTVIAKLPKLIPDSYVISAKGCPGEDYAHFTSEGYRELGRRYATQMLELLDVTSIEEIVMEENPRVDVYNILGVKLRSQIVASEAIQGLPAGIYIVGGKKVVVDLR